MENKQTAVEWLINVFAHNDILDHKVLSSDARLYNLYIRLVEQAKEMEKAATISKKEMVEISDDVLKKTLEDMNKQPMTFVPNEISDEEIDAAADKANGYGYYGKNGEKYNAFNEGWKEAIKWYREQLKKKQDGTI